MTTLTSARKHSAHSELESVLSRVANALIVWNERRVTRNALSQLTDRELEDIGLTRGDIPRVARNI